ncbi:MAG: ECF transporter S component [Clostridia bacterium]|nr:ECF transporter S component [Clostridia bacterium]
MKHKRLINLVLSSLFIALGIVLPFLTGQIPKIGSMLLPMHIPVLLCGLICSWQYGLAVGFITPLLRSFLFGMPPMFPVAAAMAFELAAYGFFVGLLYNKSRWKCVVSLYRCMIAAMIAGRAVWGVVMAIMLGMNGSAFTWRAFIYGAFIDAIPGIIVQLILIPSIMIALERTKLVTFSHGAKHHKTVKE